MADTRSMALRMALDSVAITGGAWSDDAIIRRAEAFDTFLSLEPTAPPEPTPDFDSGDDFITRAEVEDMINTALRQISRVDGLFYPNGGVGGQPGVFRG